MREYSQQQLYCLWLSRVTEGDWRLYTALGNEYGGARGVFEAASEKRLSLSKRLNEKRLGYIMGAAKKENLEKYADWLNRAGIDAVTYDAPDYPRLLHEISDAPHVLYVKGRLPDNDKLAIAIIGSRECTEYGSAVARVLSEELARLGVCVISGLARGIDGICAGGALRAGRHCPTVAVLGCGVDVVYPEENRKLYDEVAERGALVSEFVPTTKPLKQNFPSRNRIISGLSRGVVVIEAGSRSGTSITANHALDQGRDVFCVPGRVTDKKSEGTNRLISSGAAKSVSCINDILCEYEMAGDKKPLIGAQLLSPAEGNPAEGNPAEGNPAEGNSIEEAPVESALKKKSAKKKKQDAQAQTESSETLQTKEKIDYSLLQPVQAAICGCLEDAPKSFDEISDLTQIAAAELNSALTSLEFSGIIKQSPGRVYSL